MIIEQGTIRDHGRQCGYIVEDYFTRTIASQGMVPLNFKWNMYEALENAKACKLFIAHYAWGQMAYGLIHGFALYIVQPHLHHDNQMVAQCDMIGVRPQSRNRGIGKALIEHATEALRKDGVTHMVHHHRVIYDTKPLFAKLGFKLEELGYVKEL